jgi:hypothetical protein
VLRAATGAAPNAMPTSEGTTRRGGAPAITAEAGVPCDGAPAITAVYAVPAEKSHQRSINPALSSRYDVL